MTEAGGPIPWELPPLWGDTASLDGVAILCRPLESTDEEAINRRAKLIRELTRRNARFVDSEAQVADTDLERLGLVLGVDTLRPVPIVRLCPHQQRGLRRLENERRVLALRLGYPGAPPGGFLSHMWPFWVTLCQEAKMERRRERAAIHNSQGGLGSGVETFGVQIPNQFDDSGREDLYVLFVVKEEYCHVP
ncbi:hypothetical protein DB88DRAFT_377736 [Papiliotrema laurentii]|uniref:Uncharacterized protein n=1 Tax=Papiliotrema laurentii TaxID=5418 RepID=A0AAD9CTT6_PAPLA|nr:hypothetical protein DB88DRAFT_377736 [Papiliotrema laurentii]